MRTPFCSATFLCICTACCTHTRGIWSVFAHPGDRDYERGLSVIDEINRAVLYSRSSLSEATSTGTVGSGVAFVDSICLWGYLY